MVATLAVVLKTYALFRTCLCHTAAGQINALAFAFVPFRSRIAPTFELPFHWSISSMAISLRPCCRGVTFTPSLRQWEQVIFGLRRFETLKQVSKMESNGFDGSVKLLPLAS